MKGVCVADRKALPVHRSDDKRNWVDIEVADLLDSEAKLIGEEAREKLAEVLGVAITRYITHVLTTLPPMEGFIVLARKLLHMTYAEIAAELHKSEGAIRTAYSRGMKHLKERGD
jgi:DNA-directed RNA polymerase specialized sigma24 family protein